MTVSRQPVKSMKRTRLQTRLPGLQEYNTSLWQLDNHDAEAFRLNQIAAEKGLHDAVLAMGWFYLNGVGVETNISEAVSWYKKAARSGDLSAFYSLGHIAYLQKDFGEARVWLERAIQRGHARSNYLLARMYWAGKGVERDRKAARRFLAKAAAENIAEARRAERFLSYLGSREA